MRSWFLHIRFVINSLWWCFLLSRTYWHVEVSASSLIHLQLFSIVLSYSPSRSCKNWLLMRAILNPSSSLVPRRRAVLDFVMLFVQMFNASLVTVSSWQPPASGDLKICQILSSFARLPLTWILQQCKNDRPSSL